MHMINSSRFKIINYILAQANTITMINSSRSKKLQILTSSSI